jgi:predicted phosphodiesterase
MSANVTKKLKNKQKKLQIHTPGRAAGTANLWFILPDIHFPDHDETALAVALEAHRILQPDYSLFLGDVLDCGLFSSHAKKTIAESQGYDFKEKEIDPCNDMLDNVQSNTKQFTYFLEGNHEQRIERWAVNNGKVGESIYKLISPSHTLWKEPKRTKFKMIPYEVSTGNRMGHVEIVKPTNKMRTGGLVAVHGWSFAKHAARVHLEKSRSRSIVYGHTHRMQLDVSRDPWTGKPIKAMSPGTLSKLQPIYAHGGSPSEWSAGFCLVYVGQESWTEYLVNIVNGGAVLPDGREIKL